MENTTIEYVVIAPCTIEGKAKEPDQKVCLNPKSAIAVALTRFQQIKPVPGSKPVAVEAEQPKEKIDDGTTRGELLKKSAAELREIGSQLGLAFQADDTKPEIVRAIMKATGYKVD